jgi:hypothetical protein
VNGGETTVHGVELKLFGFHTMTTGTFNSGSLVVVVFDRTRLLQLRAVVVTNPRSAINAHLGRFITTPNFMLFNSNSGSLTRP